MGVNIVDKYSLLHFSTGVVAYYANVPFAILFLGHLIFESIENSVRGRLFINNELKWWPGGKPEQDSLKNSVSDQVFATLGWLAAQSLSKSKSPTV